MEILFKKYFDRPDNILNTNELWTEIKKDPEYNDKIKKVDFTTWVASHEDRQTEKIKYTKSIDSYHPIYAPPNSYQCDLMYYYEYEKINKGYDAIMNIIEITTKKVYSYPLKSKTSDEVFKAFELFLKSIDNKLHLLEIDKGTEFSKVIKYCDENKIDIVIYNGDSLSMSIIERFNRTLRNFIKKVCKDKVWYLKLNTIVDQYNDKVHSSTDYTPNYLSEHPKLQEKINDQIIWDSVPSKLELKKFKVGDQVRVYKKKKLFDKGSGGYSDEKHTITAIMGNSIYLDDDAKKKYRFRNVSKVGHISIPKKEVENNEADMVAKNFKAARKLHKDLGITGTKVRDTNTMLQENLNKPKETRIRKQVDRLKF